MSLVRDVIALVGLLVINTIAVYLRFMSNFSNATVGISPRTVSNLLARYDELLAVKLGDSKRLKEILNQQQHVILAMMGYNRTWDRKCCG